MSRSSRKDGALPFPVPTPEPAAPSPFLEALREACEGLPHSWRLILRSTADETRLLAGNPSTHEQIRRLAKIELGGELMVKLSPQMMPGQKNQITRLFEFLAETTHHRGAKQILKAKRLAIY